MRLTAGDLPKVSHAKSWIERDRLRRNIRSHGFETHASCDTDQPGPGRDSLGVYVTRAAHGDMVVCRNMARETSDPEFMRASSRAGSGITIFMSHGLPRLHSSDSYVSSAPRVRCPARIQNKTR